MDANYIYLDGQEEREQLIAQVQEVRQGILNLAKQVPEPHHYLPRYGHHSLAAMLVHLWLFDSAMLWLIRAAANGYTLRPAKRFIRLLDYILMRFFRKRLVSITIKNIQNREDEICEFIRTIPVDKLSADVYHPGKRNPYTIERALQIYFVQYWQHYFKVMQHVDGVVGKT